MMRGKLGQVSVRHKTNKKGLNLKAQYINKQMILIEYKTKCSGKLESKIFCLLPPLRSTDEHIVRPIPATAKLPVVLVSPYPMGLHPFWMWSENHSW